MQQALRSGPVPGDLTRIISLDLGTPTASTFTTPLRQSLRSGESSTCPRTHHPTQVLGPATRDQAPAQRLQEGTGKKFTCFFQTKRRGGEDEGKRDKHFEQKGREAEGSKSEQVLFRERRRKARVGC